MIHESWVNSKPQDIVIMLKWLCQSAPKSYSHLANELGMSVGEVYQGTQRATAAGLFDAVVKRPRVYALSYSQDHADRF